MTKVANVHRTFCNIDGVTKMLWRTSVFAVIKKFVQKNPVDDKERAVVLQNCEVFRMEGRGIKQTG